MRASKKGKGGGSPKYGTCALQDLAHPILHHSSFTNTHLERLIIQYVILYFFLSVVLKNFCKIHQSATESGCLIS